MTRGQKGEHAMRIEFTSWGPGNVGDVYALRTNEFDSDLEFVQRSIERRSGCYFGGGPRSDGREVDRDGNVITHTYQGTLCHGDGIVDGEIWFTIYND